jgi:hypothetical protein
MKTLQSLGGHHVATCCYLYNKSVLDIWGNFIESVET